MNAKATDAMVKAAQSAFNKNKPRSVTWTLSSTAARAMIEAALAAAADPSGT